MAIKVAIFGIFYPLAMLRYFWDALEDRDDVELWTCGPFTGNWIPWNGGMTIPQKYVKTPDFPLPAEMINKEMPPGIVENQMPWTPDLSLVIDAGFHFNSRPPGRIVAHIKTDPHVLGMWYKPFRKYVDYSFTMQTPYMEKDDFYLPYAYSRRYHYPENREKIYDACMIGLKYNQRNRLVRALRAKGLNVYYDLGVVYDEYRKTYGQSKIALSWSSLQDLPARVWEAFGMGLPLVTNRVPDLPTFFVEGEHYLGFDNVQEAVKQVDFLLNNPEFANEMADAGYRKVKSHTWNARIQQILETVKLI